MMLQLVRRLHSTLTSRAGETSLLAKLRKKTGYTIANCKKALEMHKNDENKAEKWLNDQAQAMGWAKATKLAGREASQGLVAVKYDRHHGALVELNCETDFVAKNEKFHKMIEEATNACFKFAHKSLQAKGPVTKMSLDGEQLTNLTSDGKTLGEKLALMIGSVGENAVLRRAECWKTNTDDITLVGYSHPAPTKVTDYSAGKYAALLIYKQGKGEAEIGRKLCQHIVGLNPRKIGDTEKDKPAKDSDDEQCLIFQEFLLDPNVTVDEVLKENEIQVMDYIRFACGDSTDPINLPGVEKQPLENVQTLQ